MEKGGIVNVLIAFVCFVTLFIGLGKLFLFFSIRRSKKVFASFIMMDKETEITINKHKRDWLLYHFLNIYHKHTQKSTKYFYNYFREFLLETVPKFEDGLNAMAAWTSVAPLLGLLGTVVGMVKTFSIITHFGIGNPNLLAEGISVALLTTQSGLIAAFPCLLFHNYLVGKKNAIVKELITDIEQLLIWLEKREKVC
jgi:biopolymer transport protein ExbB/TolQ